MQQQDLRQPEGATHKRKRIGRGNASGHGTYSTKGMKGQKARSGGGVRPGFEGGQLPFVRRMAYKRGFFNPFRVDYEEVNVGVLASFAAGTEITVEALQKVRIVRTSRPVKILGEGELSASLKVAAHSFSKSAIAKIEAAGGSVTWINGEPQPKEPTTARGPLERAAKKAKKAAPAAAKDASAEAKDAPADSEDAPKEAKPGAEAGEEA